MKYFLNIHSIILITNAKLAMKRENAESQLALPLSLSSEDFRFFPLCSDSPNCRGGSTEPSPELSLLIPGSE